MFRQLKYNLKTSIFEIENISNYLDEALDGINIPHDKYNNILLAITEAVNNAIIHGNKNDINKKIILEFILTDEFLKVIVTDEGQGFDLDKVPDPTLPENLLSEHGRGIFIMKHFVDEISVEKSPEGSSLILKIKLTKN
ncbi:MAG: ATP-binding protein [Ignavibacteria bacterium]|jgi:serine/threonine-protein kinase RsbW|nr:ATP-binding protein [Ignavibacteria bacterium]MDH7528718.1 ATP-binding protein [Ignavibacteria bacterium]NPV10216.1 ATP-binding protein [Ignavibacteria bacterium]